MRRALPALALALAACGPAAAQPAASPAASSCPPATAAPRAPLGATAIASSTHGELVASNAVDGRVDTKWSSTRPVANSWLRLDLGAPTAVVAFRLVQTEHADWRASAYALQAADAASGPWIDAHVVASARADSGAVALADARTARHWRVLATAGGGNGWEIATLELYGPAAPTPAAPAECGR